MGGIQYTHAVELNQHACMSDTCTHSKKKKNLIPSLAFILPRSSICTPSYDDEATRGFGSEQTFHFPLALRGSRNVVEIISQSREKGKGDQCLHVTSPWSTGYDTPINLCGLRVSLLTSDTVEGQEDCLFVDNRCIRPGLPDHLKSPPQFIEWR